ncbi:DNA-binding IclR family transcriptional regulator [Streptomyces tendae]|uniref:hypothetical protein n=1 Tax=Streptomyces tendae TaxID=1932 RepID=UPI003832AE6E
MLKYRGFAEQGGDKAYRPGPVLRDAGAGARSGPDVREVARPCLEALNQRVGETVHLTVVSAPMCGSSTRSRADMRRTWDPGRAW